MNTNHYKKLLEDEKKKLEGELDSVGRINPSNPRDWEPTPEKMDTQYADKNEAADALEEYGERVGVETTLEARLQEVNAALERIEKRSFGICEDGGEEIEDDRLEANPAARTCKKHTT